MRLIDADKLRQDILVDKTNDPDVTKYYADMVDGMETQQADTWIPITERLPEDRLDVDVTIKEKSNEVGGYRYYTAVAWMQDNRWVFKRSQYEPIIIAWKYRPTPYKEESIENKRNS